MMDKLRGMLSRNYSTQENEADGSSPSTAATSSAATPNADTAERGMIAEALDASSLSWTTRMQGFAACFVLGVVSSLLACVTFSLTFNLFTFGVLYTLGNVVALGSTLFLMGPVKQIQRMFSKERWIASSVMLACLLLTLVSAFVLQKKGLTILFCLFQFLAMTWYCLSYIPFARDAVIKFFNSCIGG